MAFRYCISLCFLFAPEQQTRRRFLNPVQKMSDEDYEKTMSKVKEIQDELSRKRMSLRKGV